MLSTRDSLANDYRTCEILPRAFSPADEKSEGMLHAAVSLASRKASCGLDLTVQHGLNKVTALLSKHAQSKHFCVISKFESK